MSIKFSDIAKKTRKVELSFQDEVLELEYRVNVTTPAFMAELAGIEDFRESLIFQLERVLVHWTLTDDDGNALEPTHDLLMQLPTPMLANILEVIVEDMKVASEVKKA